MATAHGAPGRVAALFAGAVLLVLRNGFGQVTVPTMVAVQDLAWSADGLKVFFSAMRVKSDYSDYTPDKWGVYRYDLGSGVVRLIAPAAFSVCASPREPLVIVGKLLNGNRDLYLLDENGREIKRLTTHSAEDFGAAWSPDSKSIAFTSKRGGHSEIFVARNDGSDPHRLIDAGADRTLNPTWSPDGKLIAYYRAKGDGRDQVFVVQADGSAAMNVSSDTFLNVYPGWTPDGRVVYGRSAKGSPTVTAYSVNVDGSDKKPLLNIRSFFTRFSVDGSKIAYLESPPDTNAVSVVIADTTGRVLVRVPLTSIGSPPDSAQVHRIERQAFGGRKVKSLTPGSGWNKPIAERQ